VIHTVGPNRYRGQTDPGLLARCFASSLDVAAGLGAGTMAFPAVSAGAYGWGVADVARIAVGAVRGRADELGLELVRFVLFSDAALSAFEDALAAHRPPFTHGVMTPLANTDDSAPARG
jgi:O-acetyl-ADP-ribose deacetylase (regulator of RNase III)